ncbi:uncharacterized protein LOC107981492 isoform X4 [Nasonia vitripennis]|uniref:Uncharacterized protein n=1 Tax=Nasonia vitripennis TaxID=7425 RepID=A0A7M7Q9A2_NASVI|nr:uncharacterized protein LOC107981492 isoform X4 [Nasonia vitripennis]
MKINKIIMYIMQQGTKVVDYSRRWVYCPSEACVVSPEGIIDITFVLHIVLYSRLNCVVTLFLEKWDLLSYRHFNKNIPQRKLSRPGFRPQGPGQKQRRTTARPAQRPLQRRLLLEVLASEAIRMLLPSFWDQVLHPGLKLRDRVADFQKDGASFKYGS